MKALIKLAKELDFNNEVEYFDYCIDSHINGNMMQCRKLFYNMKKEDQKELIRYIDNTEIKNFYFELL